MSPLRKLVRFLDVMLGVIMTRSDGVNEVETAIFWRGTNYGEVSVTTGDSTSPAIVTAGNS